MKKLNLLFLLAIMSCLTTFESPNTSSIQEFTGIWLGSMKISEALQLRIAFVIDDGANGGLSATMNIIEQKAFDIPMDTVIVSKNQLEIVFAAAGISYSGRYITEDQSFKGEYKQGDDTFDLVLNKVEKLPGEVIRTQTPKGPFPYSYEEVIFHNSKDDVDLAGTLTLPESGNSSPAIILVHGSGHTDRNETKMGHFHLLADYFTRNGFVVLRYDKRGVGSSTGNYDDATTFDFAKDLESGIEFLKKRDDVDSNKIGIIGHSEGSLIAPMVASADKDLAFIILMGCMGVNGGEIRLQQTEKISQLNGVPNEQIQLEIAKIKSYHNVIRKDGSNGSKYNTIKEMYPDMADGLINYLLMPWYQNFISIEPTEYLRKVSCPVLAISGEKDVQCPPNENLPKIETALERGVTDKYLVKSLPNLNHLFQTSKSGLPIEYENIAEIIAPSVLELMLEWINVK